MGIWDEATSHWTPLDTNPVTFNNENRMLVQRMPLDKVLKYCPGIGACELELSSDGDQEWEPGAVATGRQYIDFSR
jgi:hypothetical protein